MHVKITMFYLKVLYNLFNLILTWQINNSYNNTMFNITSYFDCCIINNSI